MYVKRDRNFLNKVLRQQLAEQYSKDKDVNLNIASKRFSDEEIRSVIEEQALLGLTFLESLNIFLKTQT